MNELNKAEQVVRCAGCIGESLCDVRQGIGVIRECDRLIFGNLFIGIEGDIQPGDLFCWVSRVAGIGTCGQIKCEISISERFSINGDGERSFNGIELSRGL